MRSSFPAPDRPTSRDTMGQYFLAAYDRDPDRVLACWSGGTMTNREVLLRTAAIAERLEELGVGRGDFVGCYLEEQLPSMLFDLACSLTGVIPVPLSPVFSFDYFLNGIVNRVGARAILTTPARIEDVCKGGGGRPLVLSGDPGLAYGFLPGHQPPDDPGRNIDIVGIRPSVSEGQAREMLARTSHGIDSSDIFMVQPTSGSTGQPKLVLRTHTSFTRYAHFVGRELPEDGEARFLMVATLIHAFGLHMLTTALRQGASVCVPRELDAAAKLTEVRQLDPTVLPLLPRIQCSFYSQWQDRSRPMFGPSARVICSAGGAAAREVLDEFRRQDLEVIVFYGSTEASVVAVTPQQGWRAGHAGKVVDDAEIKVCEDGEILVRSPGVTPGYHDDEEITAAAFTPDRFYRTGDLGEVTVDGYLRVFGRKRDVFNTEEGSNIYPQRVEQMIEIQGWAEQALLFGDGKPFLVALIALSDADKFGLEPGTLLSENQARAEYSAIGEKLATLNLGLEKIEQIVRFLLFVPPFSSRAYQLVGSGKVRRVRKASNEIYAQPVARLYTEDPCYGLLTFVPGADRRLRPSADDNVASALRAVRALSETRTL
jgi:long-subunit acyl-CoA synthetase (AMP-forming)